MRDIKIAADLAFRVMVLLFAVTFGVIFLLAGARAALAASLKPVAVLTEDVLTAGDIFQGLSADKATYVLGPAPQAGHDMVLNARTLMRIATVVDLPWQPRHSAEQITVRRAATIIDTDMITSEISDRLKESGVSNKFEISYSTAAPSIVLPHDMKAAMEISNFDYDPSNNRFNAVIVAPSKAQPLHEVKISGKVNRLVSVPVLKSALRRGDIIGHTDVEYIEISSNRLQNDYILDAEKIVGMTPRRVAMSGEPLRTTEFDYPQIVSRGEFITIIYDDGPMKLTAKGKALQNGAKGDIVSVVNVSSNRTVQGIISDQQEITVQ
jgi:flagella basal body P-ring formation protein FlgA